MTTGVEEGDVRPPVVSYWVLSRLGLECLVVFRLGVGVGPGVLSPVDGRVARSGTD